MEILFECVVDHSVVPVQKLILLSELRRKEVYGRYAGLLKELITALKRPSARLTAQPLFQWPEWGLESPCFRFELHRALSKMHDHHFAKAETAIASAAFEDAETGYMKALQASLELVKNLTSWTAQHVELKRFPLMHLNHLLSVVAKNKCLVLYSRYRALNSDDWEHGNTTATVRQALDCIKTASQFATTSALLWRSDSLPGGSPPSILEGELQQAYYRTASLCGSTFQERLDYANANTASGVNSDAKCAAVMELNDRLYFLTPNSVEAPKEVDVNTILCNAI